MANRRMFSKTITSSSRFLMMSPSAQNLYFHLGMNADDDGFCEHFMIMRMTESKPDDLRALYERGFVKIFDDKVLIILDWKENNYIQKDRYTPSKYLKFYKDELKLLATAGRQAADQSDTECIQNGYTGKDRLELGKDSIDEKTAAPKGGRAKNDIEKLVDFYFQVREWDDMPKEFYIENGISYGRCCHEAKEILELAGGDLERAREAVQKVRDWAEGNGLEWILGTTTKKWLELDKLKV